VRKVIFIGLLVLLLSLIASCGGVQRNPATPPWGQGQQTPGETPKAGEQEGKAGEAGGQGKILQGDYDTLIPQAESYLEKGDLENAFNAYHSALQQKAGDAQAGIGKAICQIAKDWRTFAIFRGAGADKLFYNTPLLMHAELLPNPITADDSYLLRLMTIGRRYEETFNINLPSWGIKPMPPNTGIKPPGAVGGEKKPTPETGAEKPKGGEEGKEPPKEGTPGETPPDEGGVQPPDGSQPPSGEQPPGGEGDSPGEPQAWSHEGWEPLSNRTGQQQDGPNAGGPEDWEKLKEKLQGSGGQPPPGVGPITPPETPAPAQLPEGTKPIDSEYFKTELPLTVAKLEDEAAAFRMENFKTLATSMHSNLVTIIGLLESISSGVKDDFTFQAGFVLRDKTEKYEIMFKKQDYDLMLAELRILEGIAGYVASYNTTLSVVNYSHQLKDANADGHYSADEYYPATPFGTILEGGQDLLTEAKDNYTQGLESAVEAWDLVLERALNAPTESTNEMLALAGGGDGPTALETQKKLYNDFATNFEDALNVELDAKGGPTEVKVAPGVLFQNVLGDVRALLPCVDTMGSLIPCAESAEIWPNPTFAGLFPDGLKDDSTVIRVGKIKGKAANSSFILYEGGKITYPAGESDISENGEFLLATVEFNELIGLPITLTPKSGEPWKGTLHSMNEYIYTMPEILVPQTGMGGMIPGLGGTGAPGGGGGNTGTNGPRSGPAAGTFTPH